MRIGLVESLNARPLTWGIEQSKFHDLVYASPKLLSELLLEGKLDTALISSVEILRHRDLLNYSRSCGVCSKNLVRSILFFKNKKEPFPQKEYRVDNGSKSSVSLFQILHTWTYQITPDIVPTPPHEIKEQIVQGKGSHMLFGDNALSVEWDPDIYETIDLARWWNDRTNCYFIFALWAYPKDKEIPDNFFLKSLEVGLSSIEEIIQSTQSTKSLPQGEEWMRKYLTDDLQYIPEANHWMGLSLYEKTLLELKLL